MSHTDTLQTAGNAEGLPRDVLPVDSEDGVASRATRAAREQATRSTGSDPWSRWQTLVLLPLLGLLAVTAVMHVTNADLAICSLFYDHVDGVWSYGDAIIWKKLYDWGPLPGLALGLAGLTVWVISWFHRRIRPLGEAGFFLAALLALGPGLFVNGVFKPYLCRPRPHQVTDFGGEQSFVAAWGMGTSVKGKSFPCGHASMGFYLMAPAFLLYRRRRRLAIGFVCLGLVCGSAIGLARIAEGDHFPSDVLWAAGMVYLCGLGLAYLLRRVQQFSYRSAASTDELERRTGVPSIPLVPAGGGVRHAPARRDAA